MDDAKRPTPIPPFVHSLGYALAPRLLLVGGCFLLAAIGWFGVQRRRPIVSVERRAPIVEGDRMRLMQVVLNLLQNALTHAPESKRIEVRLSRASNRARIQVQDHGPGIAPDTQSELFTRFYQGHFSQQSRSGGLGLGLFIARQIVEQHAGTIGVQSALGEGATFTVQLPLLPRENNT